MAKNYNYRLIQIMESYSPSEIAKLFNIDRNTCFRWIKKEGLKVVEQNTNPLLIMGDDLKEFILKKRQKRKRKLGKNDFFCVKCKRAVMPKNGSLQTIKTGKTIGKNKAEQFKKIGVCEFCGGRLNRFLRVSQRD